MAATTKTQHGNDKDGETHGVRFYGVDAELFAAVGEYLARALRKGSPVVVIATPAHTDGLRAHLRRLGVDVDEAIASGDAHFLDAEETLARFMTGSRPDRARFRFAILPFVKRSDGRSVAAYGEMVDVLWRAGETAAALQLEELWNELRKETSFSLLCTYAEAADAHAHRVICDAHDVVHLRPSDKDNLLLAEIAHRKEVEGELRRALRELRVTEERHRDFLENAAMPMHIVDGDARVVWVNQAELDLLGYAREEVIGRSIRDVHVDDDVIARILAKLSAGDVLRDEPARLRAKDGRVLHVCITSNARIVDGKIAGTRCFTRDVTEERIATAKQQELVAELQETVRFNELFTGMLGHDLRNPLSAMLSATHLALVRGGEVVEKPLMRVLSSGERMSRMIDQLLDFTRVRIGGGIPIRPRRSDLTQLLQKIVEEHADAPAKVRFACTAPLKGVWDDDRLAQVFSNLIGNAVEHGTPETGVDVRVEELAGERVSVEVRNAGVIDAALLPRVFEPLAVAAHRKRDGSRGLGLGLHISQRIVEAHGGTITATSSDADGTRFRVELPRGASRDTVLVVDDDVDIRETLREILEQEGFEVVTAASGGPALEVLEGNVPSLVLLDLMMPGIDGNEVYARIKASPRLRDVPVIISTSAPERAPEGAVILKKPLDVTRLLHTMRRATTNA